MDRKTLKVGINIFSLVALALFAVMYFSKPPVFKGTAYVEPYPVASEVSLKRADGSVFRLSEQNNKITLLFFGFTHCPDVCPTTLAQLNQAMAGIGSKAEFVQVVLVTVDPDRDSAQVIQEYVDQFNPVFIGLSGSLSELEKIWFDYGVYREIVKSSDAHGGSPDDYDVEHTARVTLIDQNNNVRLSYGLDTPVEDIIHDLKILIP